MTLSLSWQLHPAPPFGGAGFVFGKIAVSEAADTLVSALPAQLIADNIYIMHGLLLFYKPRGWRNRDVITFFRRLSGERRVGHGGTLDPTAEGLLIIGLGRTATRTLASFLNHSQKTYRATLRLGARSTTGDAEGELSAVLNISSPTRKQIEALIMERFMGERLQQPPIYSALKIRGQRARDRAARGELVELAPRLVQLEAWRLLRYDWPELELELMVSSGFYVRSLATELGEVLGTGAYLTALVRTEITCNDVRYNLDRALRPDDTEKTIELMSIFSGIVQGVGFREFIRTQAEQFGLSGWVENRNDGAVTVLAQGQRTPLEQFQKTMESGPGRIERVDFLWQRPIELFAGFIIK